LSSRAAGEAIQAQTCGKRSTGLPPAGRLALTGGGNGPFFLRR